ncbi:MAG: hypothetical protein WBC44_13045 [Planctomycetaceae bacterium]
MAVGNFRYLSWFADAASALVAIYLAVPLSVVVWELEIDEVFDVARELLNPEFAGAVLLFNGPAALLGFLAARLSGRGKPASIATAFIAGGTALLIGLGTDLSFLWWLNNLFRD